MTGAKILALAARPVAIDTEIVATLRELSDRIERGEVDTVAVTFIADDTYTIKASCSPLQHLAMATMLHKRAVDRLYEAN